MLQRIEEPLNVELIVQLAGPVDFDPQYKIKQWFRTAQVMRKQASIYENEGNDQEAYLILFRYARLILDGLPKHPDAKDPQYGEAWRELRRGLQLSLARLEELKPRINERYSLYEERVKARNVLRETDAVERRIDIQKDQLFPHAKRLSLGSQYQGDIENENSSEEFCRIDAAEHSDMAVNLANIEIRRRIRESPLNSPDLEGENEGLNSKLIDTRHQLEHRSHLSSSKNRSQAYVHLRPPYSFEYPAIPHKDAQAVDTSRNLITTRSLSFQEQANAPEVPMKECIPQSHELRQKQISTQLPLIPEKVALDSSSISPSPQPDVSSSTPLLPPIATQFTNSSFLENGSPLRTVFLPSSLRHHFLEIADPNTRLNRETMGLLCGTLIRNALFISKLVIPEQTSTSDTCEMEDEEALLEYCEAQPEGLWTLGWIHTHPTQTCFMSSRDLHTHMGYQRTLLEAIAIVCAPTKSPDWGIFRLTDPPGMGAIARCHQPGLFHPHDETGLYTEALDRPGHVIEHNGLEFEVVDLRGKH